MKSWTKECPSVRHSGDSVMKRKTTHIQGALNVFKEAWKTNPEHYTLLERFFKRVQTVQENQGGHSKY